MLWFILVMLVFGLLFGLIARAIVPGPNPMTLGETWLVGIIGSFVGGFLGYALLGADREDGAIQLGGIVGSIIGAVLVLLLWRSARGDRTFSR